MNPPSPNELGIAYLLLGQYRQRDHNIGTFVQNTTDLFEKLQDSCPSLFDGRD